MDRAWGEVSCKSSKTTRSVRTTCLQVRDGWISHRSCAFIVKIRTSSTGENGSLFFSETTLDAFGIGVSKSPGLRFLGLLCFFSPWSNWFEANDGYIEIPADCEHWELTQSTSFFSIQLIPIVQDSCAERLFPGKHLTLAGHLAIGHPYVAGNVLSWKFLNQKNLYRSWMSRVG